MQNGDPPHPPLDGDDAGAALDRMAAVFGSEPMLELCGDFAVVLDHALRQLDAGEGPAVAHRVAGTAGTLGFIALWRAWLALSEGQNTAESARRESLHALATLATWREKRLQAPT